MYCTACGKVIVDDARFCAYCGKTVGYIPAPVPRQLFRSRTNRMLAGVCAGLGTYLDLDITLFRLITALTVITSGFVPGIVMYIVAWIIIPLEPQMLPACTHQPATNP